MHVTLKIDARFLSFNAHTIPSHPIMSCEICMDQQGETVLACLDFLHRMRCTKNFRTTVLSSHAIQDMYGSTRKDSTGQFGFLTVHAVYKELYSTTLGLNSMGHTASINTQGPSWPTYELDGRSCEKKNAYVKLSNHAPIHLHPKGNGVTGQRQIKALLSSKE